ncbi:hypothetical protein OG453_10765 [Streptomyces sp. NBC_01381]|uniref:3-oxoacyl-ACP synthase III family protein n=1 Tax=Streptomyces sp. NBC_01381 TaxID=2903845 RepID=UPI002256FE39|nr:hypothetical protein [Streptomyces sp. NBC_01381]MCX4667137.1 hypothetical protein [Streptomyces sp. NBC_01381]
MADPATGEHLTTTSRMAESAARQALDRAGLEPGDVDLLVVSTASPEHLLPNVATTVQHYLGLERCAAIEVRAGCAGAVQALDISRRQLADGTARTALVIGSESISPPLAPIYLGKDPQSVRMRDRLTLYTFGDGAGAVLLCAEPAGEAAGAQGEFAFVNDCMGGLRKPGMQIIGGGTDVAQAEQQRRKRLLEMKIDVPGTSTFGPKVFVTAIHDLLRRSGWSLDEVDASSCRRATRSTSPASSGRQDCRPRATRRCRAGSWRTSPRWARPGPRPCRSRSTRAGCRAGSSRDSACSCSASRRAATSTPGSR